MSNEKIIIITKQIIRRCVAVIVFDYSVGSGVPLQDELNLKQLSFDSSTCKCEWCQVIMLQKGPTPILGKFRHKSVINTISASDDV